MTPKISRRDFMISAGGVCSAGLFAGLMKFAERQNDVHSYVQSIIYRNIPDIIFDGNDLDQLVEDIARMNEGNFRSYDWFKGVIGKTVNSNFVTSMQNPVVRHIVAGYEYPIMVAFFMASDFFPLGYLKGRRISFVRSSDPYRSICGNPFAKFDELEVSFSVIKTTIKK
jgi:hypothetical protein